MPIGRGGRPQDLRSELDAGIVESAVGTDCRLQISPQFPPAGDPEGWLDGQVGLVVGRQFGRDGIATPGCDGVDVQLDSGLSRRVRGPVVDLHFERVEGVPGAGVAEHAHRGDERHRPACHRFEHARLYDGTSRPAIAVCRTLGFAGFCSIPLGSGALPDRLVSRVQEMERIGARRAL